MKHKRVRAKIPELLAEGPLSTHEIMDALKAWYPKNCPTMHSLSNILSKNTQVQIRHHHESPDNPCRVSTLIGSRHTLTVWELKE